MLCAGISILAIAIAATVPAAKAASPYSEVEKQLLAAALTLGIAGEYEPVLDPFFSEIDEDDSDDVEVELRGGREYAIVVVCDDDCDDVDVSLYDSHGRLVDKDIDEDDTALIHGRPDRTETYTVRIEVEDCDSEPCVVGAVLFAK